MKRPTRHEWKVVKITEFCRPYKALGLEDEEIWQESELAATSQTYEQAMRVANAFSHNCEGEAPVIPGVRTRVTYQIRPNR